MAVALVQDDRPDKDKVNAAPKQLGPITAWSYSALKVFEECPYRSYIQRVKKVPEPSSPAADRGSHIHQEAEDYVKGELGELPDSLKKFKDDFEELRHLYAEAQVELEGEWGFTKEWEACGWMEAVSYTHLTLPTKRIV